MDVTTTTRFGVIRHAETRWNRQKRIQGQHDSLLTDAGKYCASRWGRSLSRYSWDRILCSDLGRARQTAERINAALGVPLHLDQGLREQDWGDWVGRTVSEIRAAHPDLLEELERRGWRFCAPGGENRLSVLKRVRRALVRAADRWPGQTLLVVTHEGVIKCLANGLTGRDFVPGETQILKRAHLHWISSTAGTLRLEGLNALPLEAERAEDETAETPGSEGR